jgi:hypothetical protein
MNPLETSAPQKFKAGSRVQPQALLVLTTFLFLSCFSRAQDQNQANVTRLDHKGLESIVAFSQFLGQWAIIGIGGSIAAVLSTSYLKPSRKWRRFYLLFLPAWVFLFWSLVMASLVQRNMLAALNLKVDEGSVKIAMNGHLLSQIWTMEFGFGLLCLWLVSFLFWWMFIDTAI